jgi:DNA-binding NtrC family response regulator
VNLEWVLLIDDDPLNTRALSRWLKSEFAIETRAARTIHQADCWLRSMPRPAVIITDFDLAAGETGAVALEYFRLRGVDCPAVVLTGAPSRARAALWRSELRKVPVLSKTSFQEQLRTWLLASMTKEGRRLSGVAR